MIKKWQRFSAQQCKHLLLSLPIQTTPHHTTPRLALNRGAFYFAAVSACYPSVLRPLLAAAQRLIGCSIAYLASLADWFNLVLLRSDCI